MIKTCQLHLKARDYDAAWQAYQEYCNAGGDRMPADVWLELCRAWEGKEEYDRAAEGYERLAAAYPTERPSLLALLAAGRLTLKKLNRPSDALRLYQAAAQSPVPHLDWDSNIQAGVLEAQKDLNNSPAVSTVTF